MLFSVITITYNNLEGLTRTHKSIAAQSCDDFEWLVIDGASTDGTADYLETANAQWISEKDNGIYNAMNKGIARARGDYLVFMNAGDEFAADDVLQKVSAHINAQQNLPGFVYGDAIEDGRIRRARSHMKAAWGMFTHHQAMFYRRETLGALRYDESYKISADYKFTLQMLKQSTHILYVPVPVCVFETGGISQQNVRQGRREQRRARREVLGMTPAQNLRITSAQKCVMFVRKTCPKLYWLLRK